MIFVIAPNYKQFKLFERLEARDESKPWPAGGYRYITRPEMLLSYNGPLVIVNADQCDLLRFAEYHNDKRQPIRYVTT